MSRLKASTILFSSPMAWLEKLFINFSAHLSSGRCDSSLSWCLSSLSRLAAQSPFVAQSCALLCLWPMKSMWSHWESVHLGRSARGTRHAEIILDWLPWGVISHLLTQWGSMTTTTEIHSFVYGCCPCCEFKNTLHLSQIPLTFHNQSSTWDNWWANYVTFSSEERQR